MFPALKKSLLPLAVLALILGSAVALHTPTANADIADGVWFLDSYGGTGATCDDGGGGTIEEREVRVFGEDDPQSFLPGPTANPLRVIQIAANDDLIFCVEPELTSENVFFNITSGPGEWNDPVCSDVDCTQNVGLGGDSVTIDAAVNDITTIAMTFSCNSASVQTIRIHQDNNDNEEVRFRVMCKGPADSLQLSAIPDTVESAPALYNTSHALIRAIITDAAGNPVLPDTDVDVTSTCGVSAITSLEQRNEVLFNEGIGGINAEFGIPPLPNFLDIAEFSDDLSPEDIATTLVVPTIEVDTNAFPDSVPDHADGVPNHSEALVIFHAEGCEPGPHTVTFEINNPGTANDVEASIDITVIGPPAFITVTAAPTELVCGEKSEITVSVTDALNQQVSDHTLIEVITNHGGVLAGTGTSLANLQPVNPLSSTTVEIFDGSGIAYLITSPEHYGPYEVLAASTPSYLGTGVQDSVPVTAQVTVTCTLFEEPQVIAPDTGTGQIRPPNTGDAGLAASSDSSATLAVAAGATLLALAMLARRRFARD